MFPAQIRGRAGLSFEHMVAFEGRLKPEAESEHIMFGVPGLGQKLYVMISLYTYPFLAECDAIFA